MENVDGMIFDLLANDLHCSFVESAEYGTLKELGSDQIVEGIVRCLWKCNPRTKTSIPSFGLPGNAVDRFRIASKISNEIKLLGIRDDQIGYQALLYPNVFDSRRIFLALFEKMPKETANLEEEREMTPLEKLKAEVGEMISRQMAAASEHWVPEFCRFYQLQRIGRFWHPRGAMGEMELADKSREGEEGIWSQIAGHFDGQEMEKPKIAPKPKLPPKPKLTPRKSMEEEKLPKKEEKEEKIVDEKGNGEMMAKLEAKISEKKAQILGKRGALIELAQEIGRNVEEIEKDRQKAMEEKEANDQRLILLLEEPETSLEKLMNFVAEANSRRMALQEKFFAAKAERLEKLEEIGGNGIRGNQQNEQRLAKLNEGIGAMVKSAEEKRRIRAKLLKEWQKMGGEKERQKNEEEGIESRNKFVRRILEISAMVAKQNEQIRKTANQVQSIRKEIDQLEGHLDRTFTAINGWMASGQRSNIGGNMEHPMKMQRIHKMLVRTHDQCGLVKESIQMQGQLSRQLDELTDRVELEAQKGVDGQLERVLNDLMLIRAENHELEGKLATARRKEEGEEEIG